MLTLPLLMDETIGIFPDPEGTSPGILCLINKAIPATLAQKESKLFVNVLFQFLGICMFDLIQEASQLGIDTLFGLREDAIEPGKYSNLNHIGGVCGPELLSTPHTMSFCHVLTTLIFFFKKQSLPLTGPDPLFHLLECSFRQKPSLLSTSGFASQRRK
jgi:hypothetical protein